MPDHETLFRVASTFHQNFSAGRFDDNAPLVAEDISVDSNTARFTGRDAFVERIKRFDGPFPGLQLRDRIILLDGSKAAVHYIMQGEHRGPFGDLAATGRKIEVRAGEIFTFNDQAEMAELVTVTELDRLKAQLAGGQEVVAHVDVTLADNGLTDEAATARQRESAHRFYDALSSGSADEATALMAPDVMVQPGGDHIQGHEGFIDYVGGHRASFPDMRSEIEDVVVDGRRACVSFHRRGTHRGDFTALDGTLIAATGRTFTFRTIDFMHFNDEGLIDELITVSNSDELVTQLLV